MTKRKKIAIIVIAAVIALVAMFPIKLHYKDGGSIEYKALTYSVWDYHTLDGLRGKEVRIFGIKVIDNTYYSDETLHPNF